MAIWNQIVVPFGVKELRGCNICKNSPLIYFPEYFIKVVNHAPEVRVVVGETDGAHVGAEHIGAGRHYERFELDVLQVVVRKFGQEVGRLISRYSGQSFVVGR